MRPIGAARACSTVRSALPGRFATDVAANHAVPGRAKSNAGRAAVFVWLFASLSALIYLPLAALVIWWEKPEFGWVHYGLMFASAVLHTAYYLLLDRGYRSGDLSVVYPLARGTGPLITVLCAVLLLGNIRPRSPWPARCSSAAARSR